MSAESKADGITTVVHIITRLEFGGAQENTLYTCERLDRGRFRVKLAYGPGGLLDDWAHRLDDVDRWEVPELVREIRPISDAMAVQALARRLRAARAEHRAAGGDPRRFIAHTHSSKAGVVGRAAAAIAGVPIIVHGIHGFGFYTGQDAASYMTFLNAERAAARVTTAFFSVSENSLKEARWYGIVGPRHFTRIVRSGMELERFRANPTQRVDARRALGLSSDDEVVLTIANFKPQKDPVTLLKAFGYVARRRPNAVLLFAGDGELRPEVEAVVAEKGLADRVRLLGWREDVPALLAACDVVALSSIFEGLPRSAVQAVAARRPFVGTDVDGTSEIIRHGKNGYLVPARDPHALSKEIVRALDNRPVDPEDERRILAWDVGRMIALQEEAYDVLTRAPDSPSHQGRPA